MAKRIKFAERQKLERQAEAWFDRRDDNIPFNAFDDETEKRAIGQKILTEIRKGIHQRKIRKWAFLQTAAAVLIVCSIGITTFLQTKSASETSKVTWIAYHTEKGQFKNILLPDSSTVYLRPGSQIQVPSPFSGNKRNVRLVKGEALFDVKHDPTHPFVVATSGITTKVLGTTFIIVNYPELEDIRVKLLTGKVAINEGDNQLGMLLPNQQVTYHKASGKAMFNKMNSEEKQAWQQGEYVLNNVPMRELALALENVYGIHFIFNNKLAKLHITTQFNKNDQLTDILEQLKLIHGLDYRIKDKEVILMK